MPLKRENDNGKKITYELKSIDSYRFMSTYLEIMIKNVENAWKENKSG